MSFIQRRLEEITSLKLEVAELADFLNELCSLSSQATLSRSAEFVNRWTRDGYFKKVTLVFLSGSWTPKSCSNQETSHLCDFGKFLASINGDLNYQSKSSTSRIPFSVDEMLQHSFWSDLYHTFGGKAMEFILKQCLILFEVEEDFYIMVSLNSCLLNQKIAQYRFVNNVPRTVKGTTPARNPYGVPRFKTGSSLKNRDLRFKIRKINRKYLKSKNVVDSSSDSSSRSRSSPVKRRPAISKDSGVGSQDTRISQKRKMEYECLVNVEENKNAKRRKLSILQSSETKTDYKIPILVRKPEELVTVPCQQCRPTCVVPEGLIRWFIPSPSELETIVKLRESLKRNMNVNSVTSTTSLPHLNFIGIFQTDLFTAKFKTEKHFILKCSMKVKPPYSKIPICWSGINVRKEKAVGWSGDDNPILVTVYKISDQLAKQFNIRVNKRNNKRQRCKKQVSANFESSQSSATTNTPEEAPYGSSPYKPYDSSLALDTLAVLYRKTSLISWPLNHAVNRIQTASTTEEACQVLLQSIFQTDVGISIVQDSPPVIPRFSELIKKFVVFHRHVKNINRHINETVKRQQFKMQRNNFKTLNSTPGKTSGALSQASIKPAASTLDTFSNGTSSESSPDLFSESQKGIDSSEENLVVAAVHPSCVVVTLQQICHQCGVIDILGGRSNFRNFFKFVKKSLCLAGTKSSLQFGQVMSMLDPDKVAWLAGVSSDYKVTLLAQAVLWTFKNFVLFLVQLGFYVTEGSDTRKHSLFFLKQDWRSIVENVKTKYLKKGTLTPNGKVGKITSLKEAEVAGISARVRFVPKHNMSLRPIVNSLSSLRSVNLRERKLWKSLLSFFVRKLSPHRVRDMNVVRNQWNRFLREWRNAGRPFLYFVKMDIQDAYPSVDLKKLSCLLEKMATSEKFLNKREFRVISNSRITYQEGINPTTSDDGWNSSILSRPCIVQETKTKFQRVDLKREFSKLNVIVKKSITVCLEKHKYRLDNGLPQGWALSESLCNIYYGSMDAAYLKLFINQPGEFLATSVDDYVFISPSPVRVADFARNFSDGLKSINAELNSNKLISNIWPTNKISVPDTMCQMVTLSGNRFCLSCGHVRRDIAGYFGQDMACTLTFNLTRVTSPQEFLAARMKSMLALRLSSIFLDPQINCRERITANVFELALLLAFRFYAICRVIYPCLRVFQDESISSSTVLAIQGSANSFCSLVLGVMRSTFLTTVTTTACAPVLGKCPCSVIPQCGGCNSVSKDLEFTPLSRPEILYLTYFAFISKLNRHSEPFRINLLPSLNRKRELVHKNLTPGQREFMKNVVGRFEHQLPSEFQRIKI